MATYSGGLNNDTFSLTSSDGNSTVDGRGGDDLLIVDWSNKTSSLSGRYMDDAATLTNSLGVTIQAIDIERLRVLFGSGDDRFELFGTARAELDGSAGTDVFVGDFRDATGAIRFALDEAAGAASRVVGQGSTVIGFERVELHTGAGDDSLTGGSLADLLDAGNGNNVVNGGAGDDLITTGGGVNVVHGGAGYDHWTGAYADRIPSLLVLEQTAASTYALSDGSSVEDVEALELIGLTEVQLDLGSDFNDISVSAGTGYSKATVDASGTTSSLSATIAGSPDGIDLVLHDGETSVNLVQFDTINVTLGAGDDYLRVGVSGSGHLNGGDGIDTLYIDLGSLRSGGDAHLNRAADGRGFYIWGKQITGFERFDFEGSAGINWVSGAALDDRLAGRAGDDFLAGAGGADIISGGLGNDYLDGGGGDDQLFGGQGNDTVRYAFCRAAVTVDLRIRTVQDTGGSGTDLVLACENLVGSRFDDVLTGDGAANRLSGLSGNDLLSGLGGNDELVGAAGSDVLIGGGGSDTLSGGDDADLFVFRGKWSGGTRLAIDTITDFIRGEGDRIDVSGIDSDVSATGDQPFTFVGNASFTKTAGEIRFEARDAGVVLEGDSDGDGIADLQIRLDGATEVIAADLIL